MRFARVSSPCCYLSKLWPKAKMLTPFQILNRLQSVDLLHVLVAHISPADISTQLRSCTGSHTATESKHFDGCCDAYHSSTFSFGTMYTWVLQRTQPASSRLFSWDRQAHLSSLPPVLNPFILSKLYRNYRTSELLITISTSRARKSRHPCHATRRQTKRVAMVTCRLRVRARTGSRSDNCTHVTSPPGISRTV